MLLHLWCDFRAAFPQQRVEVQAVRGHTWKGNLVSRLRGGAINGATCPAELSQRGNSEKVSSDSEKLSRDFQHTGHHRGYKLNLQCDHLSLIITMALELLRSSKYYCSPELRMICVQEICLRISKCNRAGKKKNNSSEIPSESARRARSSVPWLLFLSSSVNECRGDLFVWGREQRGSLISTPFYLRPTAPASQPPVLSYAGVPQEAALHEGQRSGKERKPLVLSFTTKPTTAPSFGCLT